MKSAYDFRTGGAFSEMAIVDTFTKLIFGEEEEFSSSEELIIQALRLADTSVAPDTRRDLGQYLRALGVAEKVREAITDLALTWEAHTLRVGASLGVAELSEHHESAAQWMAQADAACDETPSDTGQQRDADNDHSDSNDCQCGRNPKRCHDRNPHTSTFSGVPYSISPCRPRVTAIS